MAERDDFYEDDEPIEDVIRAFEEGRRAEVKLAAYFEAHRDDPDEWGDPEPHPKSEQRQMNVMQSVRLTPEQAAFVRWAAAARGMSLSAFLRECALEKAAQPVVTMSGSIPGVITR